MTAAKKLTGAQRIILRQMRAIGFGVPDRGFNFAEAMLARQLVQAGFLRWQGPPGSEPTLHITDAGRKALEEGA